MKDTLSSIGYGSPRFFQLSKYAQLGMFYCDDPKLIRTLANGATPETRLRIKRSLRALRPYH